MFNLLSTNELSYALTQAVDQINWIWFAFSVMAVFMVGALWYSLLFFNTWVKIFLLDKNKIMQGGDMIRSFIIQFATGTLYGFVVFTMCGFAQWFGVAGVLAIAGWQMCALTFKYHGWKPFLTALMIESGYTVVGGAIYVVFAQF